MRTWRGTGGFSVDAPVRIEGEDRAGLERLVRSCARGPLALERLHAPSGIGALSTPGARLVYRLPEPDGHGHHEHRLTPLKRLARFVRPVPSRGPGPTGALAVTPRPRSSRMLWAQLLARIYEVLPPLCPACGGETKIISFITLPPTVERILLHLDLTAAPDITHSSEVCSARCPVLPCFCPQAGL